MVILLYELIIALAKFIIIKDFINIYSNVECGIAKYCG